MKKSEYFNAVRECVRTAIDERTEAQTALDVVTTNIGNRQKFSDEYIATTFMPERNRLTVRIGDAARLANEKIERLTSDYLAELEAENHLDGASLTDDAKLFSLGVTLRDSDLEKLFDKYNGNRTMQWLICAYAAQHDVKINRVAYAPNADVIAVAKSIPDIARRCVSQHKHPEFYEQFLGEGSEIAKFMGD